MISFPDSSTQDGNAAYHKKEQHFSKVLCDLKWTILVQPSSKYDMMSPPQSSSFQTTPTSVYTAYKQQL
jgi:hypothetical protein